MKRRGSQWGSYRSGITIKIYDWRGKSVQSLVLPLNRDPDSQRSTELDSKDSVFIQIPTQDRFVTRFEARSRSARPRCACFVPLDSKWNLWQEHLVRIGKAASPALVTSSVSVEPSNDGSRTSISVLVDSSTHERKAPRQHDRLPERH